MKPSLAEAVLLFDVLGHNLQEVASLTGVSLSAAQSRLHRGRKELVRRAGIKSVGSQGT
jgi:DNA-directed RNA polymerase specialized sigma24 family protein